MNTVLFLRIPPLCPVLLVMDGHGSHVYTELIAGYVLPPMMVYPRKKSVPENFREEADG